MRRNKKISARRRGLIVVFALLFIVSCGMLIRDLTRSAHERATNKALVEIVEEAVSGDAEAQETDSGTVDTTQKTKPERNYRPLVQENSDLAGWLIIDGTEVDLPVMYTPDDPEYYLRKAFDGSYALSGSLFIGAGSAPDGDNIIIYGHMMKDGSMFGSLDLYAEEEYAREHSVISYDLINPDGSYERLEFEVMSAFYSRVYKVDEENVFRYYYGTDLSEPEKFDDYVRQAMSASLYDTGVTAEYGDRLLTLSTCSYHTDDGRFVVVARQRS